MSWIGWLVSAIFGVSVITGICVIIYWQIKDRKIIRELNQKKWWEESK